MDQMKLMAQKVPAEIRKIILDNRFIDQAHYATDITGSSMEYLFDVYNSFINSYEYTDWYCPKCREAVWNHWKKMKPHLEQMENAAKV